MALKRTKKINARITPEVDTKLREIVRASGSSMSSIIMQAIELYYKQGSIAASESPYEIAQRTGLIGCYKNSPSDLSQRYKEHLSSALATKYRPQ